MTGIGGYFGLELSRHSGFPHENGLLVNSARNALEAILCSLKDNAEILVPYYTCEVILTPFKRTGVTVKFYHIEDNLELPSLPVLRDNQYLLYTNYFGIKNQYSKKLSSIYRDRLILDNAQAFFDTPDDNCSVIYSPRKFVGVADGGIAVCNSLSKFELQQDTSYGTCSHLLKRCDMGAEAGYKDFISNDASLDSRPLRKMSNLTWAMLNNMDWDEIKKRRSDNFYRLHEALGKSNILQIPFPETIQSPMVYPYRTDDMSLRRRLIDNKIFVATYWPNVLRDNSPESIEYQLTESIIPLPIDQRYGPDEMETIISVVRK